MSSLSVSKTWFHPTLAALILAAAGSLAQASPIKISLQYFPTPGEYGLFWDPSPKMGSLTGVLDPLSGDAGMIWFGDRGEGIDAELREISEFSDSWAFHSKHGTEMTLTKEDILRAASAANNRFLRSKKWKDRVDGMITHCLTEPRSCGFDRGGEGVPKENGSKVSLEFYVDYVARFLFSDLEEVTRRSVAIRRYMTREVLRITFKLGDVDAASRRY